MNKQTDSEKLKHGIIILNTLKFIIETAVLAYNNPF